MPIFSWLNTYSINNKEIDEHHQAFFRIVNDLHDICVGRDKVKSFDATLEELVSYSDYHFKTEEKHMRENGYKEIDKHIAQHEYFKQKIAEFKHENSNDYKKCHELIVFLGEWILHHVVKEDKNIAH